MCTNLMKEYLCYICLCINPVLANSQCYLPELWKVYISNRELYMSTIICTLTVSILNSVWREKATKQSRSWHSDITTVQHY